MDFDELKLEKPVTTAKINQLRKKGINTVEDLLRYYPKTYKDYRNPVAIDKAVSETHVAVKGTLLSVQKKKGQRGDYITAICDDINSPYQFIVKWFNPYLFYTLYDMIGHTVLIGGYYVYDEWGRQFTNPDLFTDDENHSGILPVYRKIQGMSDEYFRNLLNTAIECYTGEDPLDEKIRKDFSLPSEKDLIRYIHMPKSREEMQEATKRLIFEDLYPLAVKMESDLLNSETKSDIIPESFRTFNMFYKLLPYDLTDDQKKVIKGFAESVKNGKRVNALIQGDVGSGKTAVAFSLMMIMQGSGYQSALMAPTGILATQHYNELSGYVNRLGLSTVLLQSGMKKTEEREALRKIKCGEADFIVGTHSVLTDKVEFKKLGLTIVDEEHKFGVEQRELLSKKAEAGVHNVTMSATPIPRSLALTIYGSAVDVYTISTMPGGRKPVKTAVADSGKKAFTFMYEEIKKGHQCYIVCPMIDSDDKDTDDKKKPASVEDIQRDAKAFFSDKGVEISVVTGRMKEDEKKNEIQKFVENKTKILIATTIIEVGVNVPNATVIAIMNAERFGLAGLHQLRGRVGRSSLQSYCILVSEETDNPRLDAMVRTTNGFEIAEEDLRLRGTGDFLGTKQSGENKNVMLMLKHPRYYEAIRNYVRKGLRS